MRQGLVDRCAAAHLGEHSIEVQLPMLAHIWPGMPIVPIAVPASEEALSFGKGLGDLLAVGAGAASTIIFASSDLTHYGQSYYRFAPAGSGQRALDYATANDCAFLDKVMDFDAKGALQVARDKRSACGAGAVAAAIEGSRCLGATKARLLEHTNSHDVSGGQAEQAENFVGYASLLFE